MGCFMKTILRSVFDEWEQVTPYKELKEDLLRYKNILSSDVYSYFEALLGLDVSILNNYSREFEEMVSGMDIYRKLAIFNNYHFARRIFECESKDIPLEIGGNERGIEGLKVEGKVGNVSFPIFDYNYSMAYDTFNRYPIQEGCKVIKTGDINLYRDCILEGDSIQEDILLNIKNCMKKLNMEKNPYLNGRKSDYTDMLISMWNLRHEVELKYYQRLFKRFNEGQIYTDGYLEQCSIQEHFDKVFRDAYGINDDNDFDEDKIHDNVRILTKQYVSGNLIENNRYL